MKKVKMTALILAATVTIGGYGLLGTSSLAVTNNIVLASSVSTTGTTTNNSGLASSSKSLIVNGVATGEGVIINGGSSFELLNSPNGSKVSSVSVGEMVTIESGNTNGYYKVEVRETGDVGYLKASNVQEIYNCQNSRLEGLSSQGTITNVSSVVNVRYKAGLNSDILETLTNGQNVTITGKQGQWYRVSINGKTGFIYGEYISLNSTTTQNTSTSSAVTNVKSANVSVTNNSEVSSRVNSARSTTKNSQTSSTVNSIKSTNESTTKNSTSTASKVPNIISMAVNTTGSATSNTGSTSTTKNATSNTGSTSTTGSATSNTGSTSTTKNAASNTGSTSTTKNATSNTGTVSASAQAVIQYAEQFEGYPYVWGGSSPSTGFDCSGFVQYVFNHFGISLPRTTYSQVNCGTAVSLSDIQVGDLVFEFGTSSAPSHVGIYIGNGEIINAAGVGQGVTISKLYNVVAVRNVL